MEEEKPPHFISPASQTFSVAEFYLSTNCKPPDKNRTFGNSVHCSHKPG